MVVSVQINDLVSSIHDSRSRILAVRVSRNALESRFTDNKNGDHGLAPPRRRAQG